MPIPTSLQAHTEFFGDTPVRFAAQLLAELAEPLKPEAEPAFAVAAALLSKAALLGHVCIDLAEQRLDQLGLNIEDWQAWASQLRSLPLVANADQLTSDADYLPMVLCGSRLYLRRYWHYEQQVAQRLLSLAAATTEPLSPAANGEILDKLFAAATAEVDWQRVAVAIALRRRLTVISGGPGTGKTTTLVKILQALQLQAGGRELKVSLAAPTGKAAGRMQQAIAQATAQATEKTIAGQPENAAVMPDQALTLHRLLGSQHRSNYFNYNHHQPLAADVVVVDEVSMVDLAIMAKLLDALAPDTRLILLGDRHQLASVEAGSVLGDIGLLQGDKPLYSAEQLAYLRPLCAAIDEHCQSGDVSSITDSVVVLQKSYRFAANSGISELAKAVNAGRHEQALAVLQNNDVDDVRWLPTVESAELLQQHLLPHWRQLMQSDSVQTALQRMDGFRILTAVRSGPHGVEPINAMAEKRLRRAGIIEHSESFYRGQPLMVRRNDASTGLANGDVGIIWPDASGHLRFWYESVGELHSISPPRLPEFETVFAMTAHKSQGSEFDKVLLLLPAMPSPVLTRELLYTAVTRAKQQVIVAASESIIRQAIAATVQRSSGLAERLQASQA